MKKKDLRLAKTVDEVSILVNLRIHLLKESNSNNDYCDWKEYSDSLRKFYINGLANGSGVAFLAFENENAIGMSVMCFYKIIPMLNNLDGKMAMMSDMYTVNEYRNRGIGTSLLNTTMEYAKKWDI